MTRTPRRTMASSSSFVILSLLSLFIISSPPLCSSTPPGAAPSATTTTIPLSFFKTAQYSDAYQKLTHLVSVSLARARHIKNPPKGSAVSTTPLFPRSYGGYSISLRFGTPPQTSSFIMDTGSSFVWFPCTKRYVCKNCPVDSSHGSRTIPAFIPKQSSSARILGCMNTKCGWIHTRTNPTSRCSDCQPPNTSSCTQACPPYMILYGSGSTGGIALVDTLNLPNKKVPNFLVGCSLFSSQQPAGIAGFGRGLSSMPSQLGLKKFSYCLLSHRFDDSGESSALVMDTDSNSDKKSANFSYTPLIKNPYVPGRSALSVYYYVGLRKISVGGQKVKVPYKYLAPDSSGNGGTIVDSGTTFTYMNSPVFELVMKAFSEQAKVYKRASDVETKTGLKPCFNISGHKTVALPELKFHFKGGAEMALPLANYFSLVGSNEVLCLTMISDNALDQDISTGPSIILGNFQMQNFNVQYDLGNERFGFRQQLCK